MSRTPNFVLNKSVTLYYGPQDERVLPSGTFVRPVQTCYLPKHVLEHPMWKWFNPDHEVFVYTRYGILAVRKDNVVEK